MQPVLSNRLRELIWNVIQFFGIGGSFEGSFEGIDPKKRIQTFGVEGMVFLFFQTDGKIEKNEPFLLFREGIKKRKNLNARSNGFLSVDAIYVYLLFGIVGLFFALVESNMTTDTRCAIMLESGAISMAAVLSCVSARRERDDSTNGDKASRGCQPVKEPRRAASKSAGTSLYSHHVDRPLVGCRITSEKLSNEFLLR